MHLKNVTLKNFRCFGELELPLHPRLTVLVAENGGGKTTVLDGIAIGLSPLLRCFSSARQRLDEDRSGKHDSGEQSQDFSLPDIEDTDFRIGDDVDPEKQRVQIITEAANGLKWDCSKGALEDAVSCATFGAQEIEAYAHAILSSFASQQRALLPVFTYFGAKRGWFKIPERLRNTKIDYAYPTSALISALTPSTDFKEMLKWFDLEETAELRAARSAVGGLFPEGKKSPALQTVRAAIASILGGAYTNPQFNEKHKFVVTSRDGRSVLQVLQLSQGYQSMLALAMDFSSRLALANRHLYDAPNVDWTAAEQYVNAHHPGGLSSTPPKGPAWAPAVMLIDEIDVHLHPSWQQRVLGDLMNAFPYTQFIVTTHSPQVLSTVRSENIRSLDPNPDGSWTAYTPDRSPYGHSNARSLEAIMHGNSYPALPITEQLREYQRLVGADQHESARAIELRRILEAEWGNTDPELQQMDIVIRKNEALRKIRAQMILTP